MGQETEKVVTTQVNWKEKHYEKEIASKKKTSVSIRFMVPMILEKQMKPMTAAIFSIDRSYALVLNRVGLYEVFWRHEANGIKIASDLAIPIRRSISLLEGDVDKETLSMFHGGITIQGLLAALHGMLRQCNQTPNARIEVVQ